MTLNEREQRIEWLHKRIQEEQDHKKFIDLVRELNDLLDRKIDPLQEKGAARRAAKFTPSVGISTRKLRDKGELNRILKIKGAQPCGSAFAQGWQPPYFAAACTLYRDELREIVSLRKNATGVPGKIRTFFFVLAWRFLTLYDLSKF